MIDTICLRLRLPSLEIGLKLGIQNWTARLRRSVNAGLNPKVREHAYTVCNHKVTSCDKLTQIRLRQDQKQRKNLLVAFQDWYKKIPPSKKQSRTVDRVTKTVITDDILDSPGPTVE